MEPCEKDDPRLTAPSLSLLLGFGLFQWAGLALGVWPEGMIGLDLPAAPLPTLIGLTTAQIVFLMLIWPIWLNQTEAAYEHAGQDRRLNGSRQLALLAVTALPFLFTSSMLADVRWLTVMSVAGFVAGMGLFVWVLSEHFHTHRAAQTLLFLFFLLGLAPPVMGYLTLEFLKTPSVSWPGWMAISPIVRVAWLAADTPVPGPRGWPMSSALIWPALGVVLTLARFRNSNND